MVESSGALTVATWIGAIASLLTAAIFGLTLKIAWDNLTEFRASERVRRTAELFFNFYTQEYMAENQQLGAPPLKCTVYVAMGNAINATAIVKNEIVMTVHNYLEAVAALHWKNLIDSELYFDSFAVVIVAVYEPLIQRLAAMGQPTSAYSRIPMSVRSRPVISSAAPSSSPERTPSRSPGCCSRRLRRRDYRSRQTRTHPDRRCPGKSSDVPSFCPERRSLRCYCHLRREDRRCQTPAHSASL
jgi:hypothetical protein